LLVFAMKCAMHAHVYALTREMARGETAISNTF
jgi:hypothetical protein